MVKDVDLKLKWAYIQFKRKVEVAYTVYFLAILLGVSLLISSYFVYNNAALKIWSILLIILLFAKLSYDAARNMKREYEEYRLMQAENKRQ